MQGPFPEARFMVSGGVSLKNVADYVKAGVTGICLGSAYLDGLLASKGKKAFVKEMQQFVMLVAAARAEKPVTRKRKR
jgi:2-keto-3-deoxy-6-phosphogluconate aldolase